MIKKIENIRIMNSDMKVLCRCEAGMMVVSFQCTLLSCRC